MIKVFVTNLGFIRPDDFITGTEIAQLLTKRDMDIQRKRLVRQAQGLQFMAIHNRVKLIVPFGCRRVAGIARPRDIVFEDSLVMVSDMIQAFYPAVGAKSSTGK